MKRDPRARQVDRDNSPPGLKIDRSARLDERGHIRDRVTKRPRPVGVPAKKIRLVFNMVELDESPERIFSGLFEYHAAAKNFTLRPDAVIHVNDIYGKLKDADKSIKDILNDPTDYKEKIKTAKDSEEKLHFAQMVGIKRLAAGVTEELDAVFKTLFK